MRLLGLLACTAFLAAAPVIAQQAQASAPINGWRYATWGMTPEQVFAASGGEAKQLAKADEYGQNRELVAPIGIDDFDLAGIRVKVRFQFRRDSMRLSQVLLQKFEAEHFVPSRSEYSRLEQLLTEKYGAATFHRDEGNKVASSWAFPSTVIEVSYLHIPRIVQSTTLMYRPVDQKVRSVY